jgi:uncharacterized protein (DUF1697 family)
LDKALELLKLNNSSNHQIIISPNQQMKYIALLRGINVSGQKKILMKDLTVLLEKNGFENVLTYIQSGNIVFDSVIKSAKEIEKIISTLILKKYKFEVEVLVIDEKYLKSVIAKNPFTKRPFFDEKKMYITFLNEKPTKEKLAELSKITSGADHWEYENLQLYFYCPDGYGKTKFSNNLVENKLKLIATTRNWNTVNVLYKMIK